MIVMRVYFEKPRTTIGWKGLICDPNIDGSDEFASGLVAARTLMSHITDIGLPIVTEFLDPLIPQYIGDLVTTGTIGARTIESQTHRQMASGLSMPIGFKNGTGGSIDFALDAMKAAEAKHTFIGIDHNGQSCLISTSGNTDGYLILRGGQVPNYEPSSIVQVIRLMDKRNSKSSIIVDCSHGNSIKYFRRQKDVFTSVVDQRIKGNSRIVGLMLESNLFEGNQPATDKPFKPGVSITDGCIGFDETKKLIETAYDML
jgi:3-deoxy-7-phosphoheptulonate synthase